MTTNRSHPRTAPAPADAAPDAHDGSQNRQPEHEAPVSQAPSVAPSDPSSQPSAEAQAQDGDLLREAIKLIRRQPESIDRNSLEHTVRLLAAPPSAPMGVEEAAEDTAAIDKAWDRFNAALAQQPAAVDGEGHQYAQSAEHGNCVHCGYPEHETMQHLAAQPGGDHG